MWGYCNVSCLPYSFAYQMQSAASNHAFLGFKHWLIYIDCFCSRHGRYERWCVEKILDQTFDIERQTQYLQRGAINISCSSYYLHTNLEDTKQFDKQYNLGELFRYILSTESADYNLLRDNCKLFKTRIWDSLMKFVEPVHYRINISGINRCRCGCLP